MVWKLRLNDGLRVVKSESSQWGKERGENRWSEREKCIWSVRWKRAENKAGKVQWKWKGVMHEECWKRGEWKIKKGEEQKVSIWEGEVRRATGQRVGMESGWIMKRV